MSMVKSSVKLYETTDDYTEAISSSRSSSVTFDNMKTIFAVFFGLLVCLAVAFVLFEYAASPLAAKTRWLLRSPVCRALKRRLRQKRPPDLRGQYRKKLAVPVLHVGSYLRPITRIYDLNAFRPALLPRSIACKSDWPSRRIAVR